jgi:hypothetical protein
VHEFRKFFDLPRRTDLPFELALDIHRDDYRDRERLEAAGWTLADPRSVAGSPEGYRKYVQESGAEFMVAKNMYVQTRSGWLSDRSLCYLASGKPVLAHDTGWTNNYDGGHGMVPFTSLDEAEEGARWIARDYAHHARAARAFAEEHFDAKRILSRLATNLGA